MSKLCKCIHLWFWATLFTVLPAYLIMPPVAYSAGDRVNLFIAQMKDSDPFWRCATASALGRIGDARAVAPLIATLKDSDWQVRNCAAGALGTIGDARGVDPLIAALKDSDSDLRRSAADALGIIKDTRAVDPLIAALKDSDPDVRGFAAVALGRIKDIRAVAPLIAALKDPDSGVARGAARGLGDIEDERAKAALWAALESDNLSLVAEAYRFFIRTGKKGTQAVLVNALSKFGNVGMARDLCNCGETELESAARRWLKKNGYDVLRTSYGSHPMWGKR